jgi:phycocyanin-associated, rod
MMLGRSVLASNINKDGRVFVYEVEGLRQSDQTSNDTHAIRQSGTVLMQVPFSRMSEFMQRMNRLGAKIVAIRTPDAAADSPEA